jgi:NADPH2:quinone reductase
MTMRAVLVREFGPPERASVAECPDPAPGADEAVVEIRAVPVNYVDLLVIGGTYQFAPKLPFIPGKGPAGVVRATGANVTTLTPGDRVLSMAEYGGYAERVAVRADHCYRLPDSMSFEDAASISLAYDTAWFALRERGRLQPGETVLVLGASGAVGRAGVQLAKAMGATVLAAGASPAKFDLLREAGADAIVDLSQPDLRESLRAQVHEATGGHGADVVLDPLGGDVFDAALRALAWRGRLVVIGFAAGRIPTIKANYLLLKNIEISGLQISDYRKRDPAKLAVCFAEIFDFFVQGKLALGPREVLPLARFADALRTIGDRSARGRILLTP